MSLIHIVAVITSHPGKRGELLSAFNQNVPLVHQEEGCIEYGAVIDTPEVGSFQTKLGDDTFFVIEKWESLDHLMAHAASDHMKSYAAKTKSLIVSRKIHVLSSV